jgi:hypothetical protein
MNWSFKVPTSFQIHKYSTENIERYTMFIEWIQSIEDWSKLKFLDEAHFIARNLTKGKITIDNNI